MSDVLLIIGILLLNAYDVFSTFQCFKLGATEGNFLAKWTMKELGFWGSVFLFKLPIIIICIIILYVIHFLWTLFILYVLIDLYNTYIWIGCIKNETKTK
jgi:C4-dicarboxylate transporter